jgi:outer membrane protein
MTAAHCERVQNRGGRRLIRAVFFNAVGVSCLLAGKPGDSAAQQITVEESVRRALEHSALIRAADADLAAARARERESRAALLPSVRAQASYTRLGGSIPEAEFTLPGLDTTFTLLPIERDRQIVEVGIEQPLFAGGRLRASARAAGREAAAEEMLFERERAAVALEVRRAFWTLHSNLAALASTDVARAQLDTHVRDVRTRYDAGALLRSELLAAETRRSEVALERVEAENAVRVAQLELGYLMGIPASSGLQPSSEIELEPLAGDLDALTSRALEARPELLAMAERVQALRARVAAVRGGRLPDLAFVSRYVYGRPNPYVFTERGRFRGTWEAGLSMSWAIWEGGAQQARTAESREQLRAAEARLEHAREQAAVDVARHYLEARRSTEAVAVAAANVELAAEALRVVTEQFNEGAALSAQGLEAERAWRAARGRQARALADYAIGRAALRHALGEVW